MEVDFDGVGYGVEREIVLCEVERFFEFVVKCIEVEEGVGE